MPIKSLAIRSVEAMTEEILADVEQMEQSLPRKGKHVSQVAALRRKLRDLQREILKLNTRTPLEREESINKILGNLSELSKDAALNYATKQFNGDFFRNEPDFDFKVELAARLCDYFNIDGNCPNGLWRAVAAKSDSVAPILYGMKQEEEEDKE